MFWLLDMIWWENRKNQVNIKWWSKLFKFMFKKYYSMGERTLDIRPYFIKSLVKKVFFFLLHFILLEHVFLGTYFAINSLDIIWSLMLLLLLFSVWVLLKIPMMILFFIIINIQMYFRYTIYQCKLSPGIYSDFFCCSVLFVCCMNGFLMEQK